MRYKIHLLKPGRGLAPMVADTQHTVAELHVIEGRGHLMVLVPSLEASLHSVFSDRHCSEEFLKKKALLELGQMGLTLVPV